MSGSICSIWYYIFQKTWSGAKSGEYVGYQGLQRYPHNFVMHKGLVSLPWSTILAGGHWSLSDLEYFGAEEVGGLMTSGWHVGIFVGIWVLKKEPVCIPILLWSTMYAMLRLKKLEIALGWNHLRNHRNFCYLIKWSQVSTAKSFLRCPRKKAF